MGEDEDLEMGDKSEECIFVKTGKNDVVLDFWLDGLGWCWYGLAETEEGKGKGDQRWGFLFLLFPF